MPSKAVRLASEARAISDAAFEQGRELTPSEHEKVTSLLARANEAKTLERQMRELEGDVSWVHGDVAAGKGPGDQFIESKGYKELMCRGLTSGPWTTGEVELETKTTLTSTPGTALVQAGYESGVVETLFQRLYVADLMPNRPAPGNPVRFVQETTATNAAAAVAETANKPESTLVFGEVSEPIRKIATFLPVSDEMLEDAPQLSAYLNQRLSLFVRIQEEAQLLLGDGTVPNLQGLVASGPRSARTLEAP
jgi:HK97 family phage major capsid protein